METKQLFDLSGRVAIVTGGFAGLGRQMAEGLAEMGATLVLCARKRDRCLQAAEDLRRHGGQVLALVCDATFHRGRIASMVIDSSSASMKTRNLFDVTL